MKHQRNKLAGYEKWRKLHVAIDVHTGEILSSKYTQSTSNDGPELPSLLTSIDDKIESVCGDMAYDTTNCRAAIKLKKARQRVPPKRNARLSKDNRNTRKHQDTLQERDDAIHYIKLILLMAMGHWPVNPGKKKVAILLDRLLKQLCGK
jgi:hypothetical protein